jgi:AraC-like DNA-binding protein
MPRIPKRIHVEVPPEKLAELREVRRQIEEERPEITARAREVRRQHEAAKAELARAAELLKAERLAQGLSLADVQGRTGMSRAAICRLENLVDANPTVATLERIADALGKRLVIALEEK